MAEYAPWDRSNIENMTCVTGDAHSTLQGAVPPFVRNDFGELPNGKPVFPIGDTWAVFDPIGGQGLNNGSRQVDFLASRLAELGTEPASKEWAAEYYGQFYENHTKWATLFNNLLLEPLDEVGLTTLLYAANNPRYCDDIIFGQFHAPKWVYKAFNDPVYAARKWRELPWTENCTSLTGRPGPSGTQLCRWESGRVQLKRGFTQRTEGRMRE